MLHVANLRVAIKRRGERDHLRELPAGRLLGRAADEHPVTSSSVGRVSPAAGSVCPPGGDAAGLPDTVIAQTDDLSGGETVTSVPELEGTAPANDAIVTGRVHRDRADRGHGSEQSRLWNGLGGAVDDHPRGLGTAVFHSANVAVPSGVSVPALAAGVYSANWVVTRHQRRHPDGHTTFVEAVAQRRSAP